MLFLLVICATALVATACLCLLAKISNQLDQLATAKEMTNLLEPLDRIPEDKQQDIAEILSSIQYQIEESNQALNEIRYVTDIIHKYKLPTVSEREFLDKVRLDMEIDDRLNKRS